jgi:branched-chain amino acid transport system permease protein
MAKKIQIRKIKILNLFIIPIALAFVPIITTDSYVIHVFILALLFGALAVSYDVIFGYAGQLNFGPAAFIGVGAYASALFTMNFGISPYLGLLMGGAISAVLGCLIGIPCLRLKGYAYVAVVTWGFAEIIKVIFANWVDVTRGYRGLWGIPALPEINLFGLVVDFTRSEVANYYVILILLTIITFLMYRLVNSKYGLFLMAIRDDDLAAETVGIDVTKYKIFAFGISSFFMGLVGGFYAHYIRILTPSLLGIDVSNQVIAYQIVGGSGTLVGPILGSLVLTGLSEYLRVMGTLRLIIFGVLMIIVIICAPAGLYGLVNRILSFIKKMVRG